METADSLFSQNNYRKMESVLFHCLSSDAYLLWGTGGNTSNSTVSLVNVNGVQQCISRCQYHMIMSVIMTYWTRPYLQIIPNTKYPRFTTAITQGTKCTKQKTSLMVYCVLLSTIPIGLNLMLMKNNAQSNPYCQCCKFCSLQRHTTARITSKQQVLQPRCRKIRKREQLYPE